MQPVRSSIENRNFTPARDVGEPGGSLIGIEINVRNADHDAVIGGARRKNAAQQNESSAQRHTQRFHGLPPNSPSIPTQMRTSSFEQIFGLDKG